MRVRVLVALLSAGILLAVWTTGITMNRLREGSFYVKDHWTGRDYECSYKGCKALHFVKFSN
jgi:hypothetical protein